MKISKISADDTSLSAKYYDFKRSEYEINKGLRNIKKWGFKWKIYFNPGPTKQAIDIC